MISSISSIITCKCPKCHKGDMFKYSLLKKPLKFTEMNTVCSECGLDLEQEPGYYYGAMYVSYGFGIIELLLTLWVLYMLNVPLNIETVMIVISAVYILLAPVNFRWGRSGWISLFFKYDKKLKGHIQH